MAEKNSIDGGGEQRQEAAGDKETIRRPSRQSELRAGEEFQRRFSKICPLAYIARHCRCDRVEQLGGTEMHNC